MLSMKFWGVRGSIPVPGPHTSVYGGNTPCIEVRAGSERMIVDGGSGIRALGRSMVNDGAATEGKPISASIFFTHFHWDHIQGFPFFSPAFVAGNRFVLYGRSTVDASLENALASQMRYPMFPISLHDMAADIVFRELVEGEPTHVNEVVVSNRILPHPGGSTALRFDFRGHSIVIATDTEHGETPNTDLIEFAQVADVLVYDSMYTPDEYLGKGQVPSRQGWGHSTWEEGVKIAQAAAVRQLVLFHYHPDHDDRRVAQIAEAARGVFRATIMAREGLELTLPQSAESE